MLGLPLQEDVALVVLFDIAECLFCLGSVMLAGGDVALDQHGIENVKAIAISWDESDGLDRRSRGLGRALPVRSETKASDISALRMSSRLLICFARSSACWYDPRAFS